MEMVERTIQLPKETTDISEGLFRMVKAIKVATSDGWQAGQDLPPIMSQALIELTNMVTGIDQIDDEFKANPSAFIKSFVLSGADIAGLFFKKDV